MIIELSDEQLIKLAELTGIEIEDRSDAEYAIAIVLDNV